jgi:SAM-dependent methyltransferase
VDVSYLTVKRSVDDRALNRYVLDQVRAHVSVGDAAQRLRVLDVGAGNGTFLARLLDWDLLRVGDYVGVDADGEAIADGRQRLSDGVACAGLQVRGMSDSGGVLLAGNGREVSARLIEGDAFALDLPDAGFDLMIANAVLDLVHVPTLLPRLWHWLRPGGFFWFTINFDGETIFLPEVDPGLEATILALYHRSMDERVRDGRPAGDRHCGRNLLGHVTASGGEILAAGASDWVVYPIGGRYPADEAIFLHHIVDTIDAELRGNPDLDPGAFAAWIATRHRQIDAAELIYIAKQLDLFGRAPVRSSRRSASCRPRSP